MHAALILPMMRCAAPGSLRGTSYSEGAEGRNRGRANTRHPCRETRGTHEPSRDARRPSPRAAHPSPRDRCGCRRCATACRIALDSQHDASTDPPRTRRLCLQQGVASPRVYIGLSRPTPLGRRSKRCGSPQAPAAEPPRSHRGRSGGSARAGPRGGCGALGLRVAGSESRRGRSRPVVAGRHVEDSAEHLESVASQPCRRPPHANGEVELPGHVAPSCRVARPAGPA